MNNKITNIALIITILGFVLLMGELVYEDYQKDINREIDLDYSKQTVELFNSLKTPIILHSVEHSIYINKAITIIDGEGQIHSFTA